MSELVDKIREYIQKVDHIKKSNFCLSEKEAAIFLRCSVYTVRRWAEKMGFKAVFIDWSRYYMFHHIKRIKLRREYAKEINKFKKNSKK